MTLEWRPRPQDVLLVLLLILTSIIVTPELSDALVPLPRHTPYNLEQPVPGPLPILLKPDIQATIIGENPWFVRTNAEGLREASFAPTPAPDTTRILVVGDSFTMGRGVDQDDRFTNQLERMLNSDPPYIQWSVPGDGPGHRYDVINAGLPDYGIRDIYVFLRERGMSYHPDVVLVGLQPTNVISYNVSQQLRKQADEVNWTEGQLRDRYMQKKPLKEIFPPYIRRINSLVTASGAQLVFFTYRRGDARLIRAIPNYPFENPLLLPMPAEGLNVLPESGYLNEHGHRQIAEGLYRGISFYNLRGGRSTEADR